MFWFTLLFCLLHTVFFHTFFMQLHYFAFVVNPYESPCRPFQHFFFEYVSECFFSVGTLELGEG